MEVSIMSPSPASLTEGDSLCEIDVTSVAIHRVTLLICLCGLAGNVAVLWLLSLKFPNYGIIELAVIDFIFLLLTLPSAFLLLVEDMSCSPIVPIMYLSFLFQLSVVSYYWGLFRFTHSRNVLNMDRLCRLCCRCDLPLCLWLVVSIVQYWGFFSLFTLIPMVTFLCPSHEQKHCRAVLISMYTIILLLFAAPVLISSTIDFIKAKWGSQQLRPKRRDIIIFLTVLFTLLLVLCNFREQLGYIIVPSQFFFLLTCIHSSIKPFIYFLAGRCWRPCSMGSLQLSLQRVFDEQKEKTDHRNDGPRDTGV